MDYTALRTEILTDPVGLGYAPFVEAGSHNMVAALLSGPRYPATGKVDVATALIWIAKHGLMARLRAAAQGDNPQVASIAEVALLLVQNPNIPAIDLALPDVQEMFGVLVAAGVITADERDELFAASIVMQTRAEMLFGRNVSADDVSEALNG